MKKVILEDNEKEVINAAYKHFKKEHKRINPSVVTEENNEVITEGLKYFKTSERLYKLAIKLERRAKQNPEILETAKKVNALGNKFEYIEDLYAIGDEKEEAKIRYKELCDKYISIIKLLKKESVRSALRATGSLAITVASMTIPFLAMGKFFPKLSLQALNSSELTGLKKAKLYLERAGAFTLCKLPVKIASKALNFGDDKAELEALKSVDRMLKGVEREHSIYDDENGNPEMQLA